MCVMVDSARGKGTPPGGRNGHDTVKTPANRENARPVVTGFDAVYDASSNFPRYATRVAREGRGEKTTS